MKHYLLMSTIALGTMLSQSQNSAEKLLLNIETQDQAKAFVKEKHKFNSKVFTFNEEKHKTQLTKALFKLQKGDMKSERTEYEKTLYKILEKNSKSYYRVAYIALDASKYSVEAIENLRTSILQKHENGVPFSTLALQYSMDDNAKKGGDTGWFSYGDMHPNFEDAVINASHQIEDIYNIDIPSKQLYYLVLQTHKPKEIAEIKVLKIVEPLK